MQEDVLDLTCELIRRRSVTPDDAGCQDMLAARLAASGFHIERLRFGAVDNLWATHGSGAPVMVLLGHTDVVPTGPVEAWSSDPFAPVVREGRLWGRGAADMKASVAAMVIALQRFVSDHPDHPGTVGLLLTSDEEGEARDGIRAVAEHFRRVGQSIDFCLVGEPSSARQLGDTVRIGRRGSLSGRLSVHGRQGHVAYPRLADNPIHRALPALAELAQRRWDEGNDEFPPTSFQIVSVHAGVGASNVIPGRLAAEFNFRYSPLQDEAGLRAAVEACLRQQVPDFVVEWQAYGAPFLTAEGRLRKAVRRAVREVCGLVPVENTAGGTSDGRFIAPLGAEVVEVGPVNASIHQVDEHIVLEDLRRLPGLYHRILQHGLSGAP